MILSRATLEVEQHHLLLAQRADPEHGTRQLVVGACRKHLHRGRRPAGQNLGGGLGLIKRLARWRYSNRRSRSTWMRSGDDGRRRAVELKPGRPDQHDERLWAAPSTSTAGSAGGAGGSVPTPPATRAVAASASPNAPASPLAKAASSASSGPRTSPARVR